jgi:hypothetical protein
MNLFTSGYAIGDVAVEEVAHWITHSAVPDAPVAMIDFKPGRDYKQWIGRDAEVKGLAKGVYLDTEYELPEAQLRALSAFSKAVLAFQYYDNMSVYSCTYFLDGKKILYRVTVVGSTLASEDPGEAFTPYATPAIIEQLFTQLTGATLAAAVETKGTLYEFKENITVL